MQSIWVFLGDQPSILIQVVVFLACIGWSGSCCFDLVIDALHLELRVDFLLDLLHLLCEASSIGLVWLWDHLVLYPDVLLKILIVLLLLCLILNCVLFVLLFVDHLDRLDSQFILPWLHTLPILFFHQETPRQDPLLWVLVVLYWLWIGMQVPHTLSVVFLEEEGCLLLNMAAVGQIDPGRSLTEKVVRALRAAELWAPTLHC